MINNYRKKFIFISMLSIFFVLTIVVGIINIINYYKTTNECDATIERIVYKQGPFSERMDFKEAPDELPIEPPKNGNDFIFDENQELKFQTRYFIVTLDNNQYQSVDLKQIASIDEASAKLFTEKVLAKGKTSGFYNKFRYLKYQENDVTKIIFMDCHRDLSLFNSFLFISILTAVGGSLLVFILILILSKIVVIPFVKNQEKQKMFITDASHELKTPLTIINADVDIVEMENGESEWTVSIRKQVERLRKLTNQLTMLAKMDEDSKDYSFSEFSLSDTLNNAYLEFQNIFNLANLEVSLNIEDNINYIGNQELFNELFFILLDNAHKYATGKIFISLAKDGKGLKIEFSNVANVPNGNLDYLFNRFTRLDSDRNSKTGGSGIGLAIAKEIVDIHQGQIKAEGMDGVIKIMIFLKN